MNNDEIRLSILCQHYRAMFNGKSYEIGEENPELGEIPRNIIKANKAYLVDKNLINGRKIYFGKELIVLTSDITAWGMDVVEKIMNTSINELDSSVSTEINQEDSPYKKFEKFCEKCVKSASMCEVVVKVANMIFSGL